MSQVSVSREASEFKEKLIDFPRLQISKIVCPLVRAKAFVSCQLADWDFFLFDILKIGINIDV